MSLRLGLHARIAGLAGLVTLFAAPAAPAAITGAEFASGSTASNSSFAAAVTTECAPGKRAFAAGYGVTGLGPVLLDDVRPLPGLNGFRIQGVEDESGFESNWDVVSFLACADPVPGLERVSATSAINSSDKGVTAACSQGRRVLGMGVDINAGNGQVVLDALRPDSDLSGVTARAVEDQTGYTGDWGLTAHAICADPVGGLALAELPSWLDSSSSNRFATATCQQGKTLLAVGGDFTGGNGEIRAHLMSASAPDLNEAVWILSEDEDGASGAWRFDASMVCVNSSVAVRPATAASTFNKGVTAPCPSGKSIFGGGGETTGATGEVAIRNIAPSLGSMRVEAAEDETDAAAEWSLQASAICSTTPAGLQLVTSTSAADSATKSATATCPAGKRVFGGGGGLSVSDGQVLLDDVQLDSGLTSVTAKAVEDETGYAETWTVRADAICAPPPPGLERVAASSGLDSSNKSVVATCPGLKNLLGVGGNINGGVGQVGISGLSADARLRSATIRASEDQNGYSAPWGITAFAVCASP